MITPKFNVNQDEEFIYIKLHISNIRFNAPGLEIVVDGNLFVFHLSPYYLRLRFPHEMVDDERCTAQYNSNDESIAVKVPKTLKGQVFEDLDLSTKLLARQGEILALDGIEAREKLSKVAGKSLIEEVGGASDINGRLSQTKEKFDWKERQQLQETGEKFNWELKQELQDSSDMLLNHKYGFDDQYESIIRISLSNGNDINELDDPENTSMDSRVLERISKENLKFDPEYYISEYMTFKYGSKEELDINGINTLLKFIPTLPKAYLKWYKHAENKDITMPVEFNGKEQEIMQNNIPKKEYLVSDIKPLYLTILSLLFAQTFEQIENEGSHNTESAWTIGKLTPQISFLDQQILPQDLIEKFSIIKAVIVTGMRRSLSYPLHRNYDLSMKCWNYVYYILRGGKRLVLRALLDIHEVFRFHEVYYVYNKILLDDLCSWFLLNGSEHLIRSLAVDLKRELDALQKKEIEFDCVVGPDENSGEVLWENLTLEEMEYLAEQEYLESNPTNGRQ
ncbi:Hsp90 cochaperone SHQ1 Ecym_3309 [Eremothecium cymbalariae DBVPG|uniref:CS domain-containing protein n=1 Tax=Eremothecium cymbalariae (strain CBS 270.75 / DBVPG 7215 / KCTC 17166 / NRRL Y-17582) TaxID=931890 RepID=G8JRN1_ERECY|nr:Hypothetical protein Ecym_3309 [Eremothecium cymbalariae DBVPG\